ncbi:hypothetical protein BDY24DRAFT_403721 [Mrakia frigida]|uniref:uncharacterized protein n=1 Tax=Mrakia frigida TaxID=29902 RepID=UPI003FCC2112
MPPKIPPMSGNPDLYHVAPKGFWKTLQQKTSIAGVSAGVPLADKNRRPAPGSRPEEYAVIATAASDVAFNPYWKRDTRRNYPNTSVITQDHLTNLLLASPEGKAIAPPAQASDSESTSLVPTESPTYTAVLEQLHPSKAIFSAEEGRLPPVAPSSRRKKILHQTEEVPYAIKGVMTMELHG